MNYDPEILLEFYDRVDGIIIDNCGSSSNPEYEECVQEMEMILEQNFLNTYINYLLNIKGMTEEALDSILLPVI